MTGTPQTSTAGSLLGRLDRAAELLTALERPDLAAGCTTAAQRLRRPDTVVAVVGEFKQGKSSLVNALLGASLSPVDDDIATATVAWFRHSPETQVVVHFRRDGARDSEPIETTALADYLTEAGNPENSRGVEIVEFGVPNPVLERGLSLLDTPGTGGIDEAVGRSVLEFLPSAHGLIFVTDASAPLNAVELRFLAQAAERCPAVVVAVAKTDLYPEWRRICELNTEHLGTVGNLDIVPVSAELRTEALRRADAAMNAESGIPELMAVLRRRVIDDAAVASQTRGQADLERSVGLVLGGLRAQRAALADRDAAERAMQELQEARARLDQIRKAGSRWSTVLSDGITDIQQAADERLRFGFRSLLEQADEELGSSDPLDVWDDYVAATRTAVTEMAAAATEVVGEGAAALAEQVAQELGESVPAISVGSVGAAGGELTLGKSKTNPFTAVLSGLKGGSSGIILLGMIGRLAGLALAAPVSIGAGVVFGVKQVMDERKRMLERRRQEARTAARRYLQEAQTDLSTGIRDQVRDVQRTLRDDVSRLLNELNETYAATIREIETSLTQAEQQRRTLLPQLEETIGQLEALVVNR